MKLHITEESKGQPLNEWIAEIDTFARLEIRAKAEVLMHETHEFMRTEIRNNVKRIGYTGNLEKNITCEFVAEGGNFNWYFWIGDIPTLNQNAKYWYWLNYGIAQTGRSIPPTNRGFFAGGLGLTGQGTPPRAGMEGEAWIHTGNRNDFLLVPKKPIQAINYIQNTIFELESKVPSLFIGLEKVGHAHGWGMGAGGAK